MHELMVAERRGVKMRNNMLETAIDYTYEAVEPLVKLGEAVTVCYNQATVWQSRSMASEFYLEAMCACEGAERERYTNVLLDLMAGLAVCHDGATKHLTWEPDYR